MRTEQTFAVSFFIRKKKKNPNQALVYTRVTVNGKPVEISLKRTVPTNKWNLSTGKMKGNSEPARLLNKKIDNSLAQLHRIYDHFHTEGKLVTAEAVKARFLGSDGQHPTLSKLLDYHKTKMVHMLEPGTLKNYSTTEKYLKEYLKKKLKTTDIYLKQIDYKFTAGFEIFLQEKSTLHNNGIMKHMERLKKMMNLAMDMEWIEKNPTTRFKLRFDPVDMVYLSQSELKAIQEAEFTKSGLELTRDIFIFACYTGLAYADIKKLKPEHLQLGIDGGKWIYTRRQKTKTSVHIPLLPQAKVILDKYQRHPKVLDKDILLPIFSNQKTNEYLKSIAAKAKVSKKLSFHAARHTFATTVTLANGVPIETVSKLLGHNKIATTQIYARVIDTKISQDMAKLRNSLSQNSEQQKIG